jgi:hypothetical protein
MDLGLVQRVRDVIWEYTRRQTRDHFGYAELVCEMEHVVINEHIVAEEGVLWNAINQSTVGATRISLLYLELHVVVQTTDYK